MDEMYGIELSISIKLFKCHIKQSKEPLAIISFQFLF